RSPLSSTRRFKPQLVLITPARGRVNRARTKAPRRSGSCDGPALEQWNENLAMWRGQRRVQVFERGGLERGAAGAKCVEEASGIFVRGQQEQQPGNAFDRFPARVPVSG